MPQEVYFCKNSPLDVAKLLESQMFRKKTDERVPENCVGAPDGSVVVSLSYSRGIPRVVAPRNELISRVSTMAAEDLRVIGEDVRGTYANGSRVHFHQFGDSFSIFAVAVINSIVHCLDDPVKQDLSQLLD
jgi:hypothetical protein